MSLFEENSLLCKLVDVGRLRLGMSSKTTDPVVQIVDSNEQDVRPVDRIGGTGSLVRWHKRDNECARHEAWKPCENIEWKPEA